MSPALKIAWRYFRGKKSAQAINIISWISVSAIAVSSAAMVILFSVFNGLEGTVKQMYSAFYPDIKVTAAKGKFFEITDNEKAKIEKISGVSLASYSLEDMVLLNADDEQKVATLKGVDENWFKVSRLDSFMVDGQASFENKNSYVPAIVGIGVAMSLRIDVQNVFTGLKIYYPKSGAVQSIMDNPEAALNSIQAKPEGSFRIQEEFDEQYILVPFQAAKYLFGTGNKISSLEVKLAPGADEEDVKAQLAEVLGKKAITANRYEQNKTFYMIMKSERWAVYAILLMVLLIASFNMIGSLSMVVLGKKKDISILKSMGARNSMVRAVFLAEGALLAIMGGGIGLLVGLLVCLGQQYFGWIALPDGFIFKAYPVEMHVEDFILVMVTALVVGLIAAWYPAARAAKQSVYVREE